MYSSSALNAWREGPKPEAVRLGSTSWVQPDGVCLFSAGLSKKEMVCGWIVGRLCVWGLLFIATNHNGFVFKGGVRI